MNGVALDFTGDMPRFGTGRVEGFGATVQNALVNIGTGQGTDPVYPERGTTLQRDAVDGKLIDLNSAQHASNFAAVDTLAFTKTYTPESDTSNLSEVRLEPADFTGTRLMIDAIFTSVAGQTVGVKTVL